MKIKDALKTVEKRSVLLLRWFFRAALITVLIGILTAKNGESMQDARHLLLLSVILVCQGIWGAVLFDCLSRRLGKRE